MSFMSPGSKFGNVMSGIMGRLPGILGGGGQIAQGIANIFDPSGGISKKIGGFTDAAQGFVSNSSNTIRGMRDQWKNGEYGGMASGVGDMMSHFGNMMNGFSQNASGVHGERMRRLGGYMDRGSDIANSAAAMIGSGQAMYKGMRDRVGQVVQQWDQGNYQDLGGNIGGGAQDMINLYRQTMRQGGGMERYARGRR